jgi:hypothetical protein
LLSRRLLSAALCRLGYPAAESSLMSLAYRDRGPAYVKWNGALVRYRWGSSLQWAESRLSQPRPQPQAVSENNHPSV